MKHQRLNGCDYPGENNNCRKKLRRNEKDFCQLQMQSRWINGFAESILETAYVFVYQTNLLYLLNAT